MPADLNALEDWAGALLAKLQPGERRKLNQDIARELRRSQQQRIAAQRNPDGTPFAPRKRQALRSKKGRIKQKMFTRLRQARYLKLKSDANRIGIAFLDRLARIARVHQYGLRDRPERGQADVQYERREVLGFTDADRELIRDQLLKHLAPLTARLAAPPLKRPLRASRARGGNHLGMNPIAELNRRLDNLIRLGTIAEVDHGTARCRVKTGQVTTDWLPWFSLRAGTTSTWNPPTVGEQCAVFSPSGELAQGIVLLGIFSTAHPAPGAQADLDRTTYSDGAVIEYDAEAHSLTAILPGGGSATLTAPGGVSITGDVAITGDISLNGKMISTGDVVAAGISLIDHTHGGVQSGRSNTGIPQ